MRTVDIDKFVEEDTVKIQNKIDKGINKNLYKNFILILDCEHNIDKQQLPEYRYLLFNYWKKVSDNPFSALFVVNYDIILFQQINKDENSSLADTPVPIFFTKN